MPTNFNFQQTNSEIDSLEAQAEASREKLRASPTALGGSGDVSPYDLENQTELERIQNSIQKLTDDKLRAQWYPEKDKSSKGGEEGVSSGWLGKGIDYISRPLYGVVGATKHIIGQGQGSFAQDVADNIARNKNTFGDVLKSSGLPYGVAAPLGFALDVGLDPVNWATMGTGALVPRLAVGAFKGAAKEGAIGAVRGLSLAAKSGVLEKATTLGRFTPFVKTGFFGKLAEKSIGATMDFEKFAGTEVEKLVLKRGVGVGSYRMGLGEIFDRVAAAVPGGENFLQHFKYDPGAGWVREARIKDVLLDTFGTGTDVGPIISAKLKGEPFEHLLGAETKKFAAKLESTPVGPSRFSIDLDSGVGRLSTQEAKDIDLGMEKLRGLGLDIKIAEEAPNIVSGVDDAYSILKNPEMGMTLDPVENAMRIASEATGSSVTLEDIAKVVNSGALGDTGVKWFDNMMMGMRNIKQLKFTRGDKIYNIGKETMDKYEQAIGIFKVAKVAASPSAWVNNVAGSLAMVHMATGRISTDFMTRLPQALNLLRGKTGSAAFFDNLMMDAQQGAIQAGLFANKTAVKGTMGFDLSAAMDSSRKVLLAAKDSGLLPKSLKAEDIAKDMAAALAEFGMNREDEISKLISSMKEGGGTTGIRKIIAEKGENVLRGDLPTDITSELFNNATIKMFEGIAEKARSNPGNMAYKALDIVFNKMPSGYSMSDQVFKTASFMVSTIDGYSRNELLRIAKLIDLNPEDIIRYTKEEAIKKGQMYYRIPANKALELSNVMFLNYAAMPSAVRVLSKMPLLGTPFASFLYGMTLKTGQTMVYNPSAFTKVGFAMKDFGGQTTPFEKEALKGEYYSYLDKPGMFRAPFFDENPIYLNLASMIPYYSLNMFTPSETNFHSDALPAKLVEHVKNMPFLKDPVGAAIFDYMIQPMILGEATAPQGQFGQALYPVDAGVGTRAAYGARTLAESMVPNIASYAGLVTPEGAADYIPSYRWRSLAYAKEGKNQLGISSKEPKSSRTIRNLFSTTGIPLQAPMNLSFAKKKKK